MLAEPSTILLFGLGLFILTLLAVTALVCIFAIRAKRLGGTIFDFAFGKMREKKNPAPSVAPSAQIIPRQCPQCGAELKPNVSEGLCPACLLQRGIATEGGAPPGTPPFVPPTIPDLARLFPQLEILELIGKGGMGAVYKARQPALDRFVALKILAPRSGDDRDFAGRFTREARALAKLSHPNIVAVHDFGTVGQASSLSPSEKMNLQSETGRMPVPFHYFIMEYVDGPNLRQIEQAGKLSPREALEIIPQICAALQFAHDEGIVHRDIKPENILLDKKGRVKIADFGLAKILGPEPKDFRLTGARDVVGTPHYMAPEQIEKPQEVDHRADIYSLGVVFYEMLTGELPLGKFQPPSFRTHGMQIDVRLDEVVLRSLEKEPERRYQQVSEVKTRVETIATSSGAGVPAAAKPGAGESTVAGRCSALPALALLAGLLALLFWRSFVPRYVLFSNDGPLGIRMAEWLRLPSGLLGLWDDLNSLGFNGGSFGESISTLILWMLGPLGASKFLAPVILCLLGMCAWFSFQRLRLAPFAALLGALGVTLSSCFFSTACWGVAPMVLGIGMSYLAIGLVVSGCRAAGKLERWASYALAGLAAGMGVVEANDVGAVFSLIVFAFVAFYSLVENGPLPARVIRGVFRTLVVAGFAFFIAGQTFIGLINTQIKGGAGTGQDMQAKAQHWDWATQWSLPKTEMLGLVVPGLFGYRMDTSDGGNYWGGIGRDPATDRWLDNGRQGAQPPGLMRFSGGGYYLGVLVALVALWAAIQALRKKDSVFTLPERKLLWFWSGVAVVCLLFAFGRFAPFYRLLYALPHFSTIRNPIKFLNPMIFSVSMIFAYGLNALWRQYMTSASSPPLTDETKNWWHRASRFDRRWAIGCALALGLGLAAWMVYANSRGSLEHYIQMGGFDEQPAHLIAAFSIRQAGWFVLRFVLAASLLTLILGRVFAGPRAKWGAWLLGLLVVFDLGRANLPWIVHWDYRQKYATNDVIEFFREKPYEHRVAELRFPGPQQPSLLGPLYHIEWAQHHFLYYNIQSLDIVQLPRMPEDLAAFETALRPQGSNTLFRMTRHWQLTNTRYLLGSASSLDPLNAELDPALHRFRIARSFDIMPKPGFALDPAPGSGVQRATKTEELTAVFNTNGQYAIFEFTGALPRAKIYSHWQVITNDQAALEQLGSAGFDPEQAVLVDTALPAGQATESADRNAAKEETVEFASYASKHIVLKTKADFASVLLLNDRFDPAWRVAVDGQPASLLRCNYIMRGVQLAPGAHTVEFTFQIPIGLPFARVEVERDTQLVELVFKVPIGLPSYITVSAFGVGLVLIGVLAVAGRRKARLDRGSKTDYF
jgi:hypothetical protein